MRDGRTQNPGWVPSPNFLRDSHPVHGHPSVYLLSPGAVWTAASRFMAHPSASIVRRSVFEDAGGFFEALWSNAEDVHLMLRVLDCARKTLYGTETVALYRLPTGNSISLMFDERLFSLQRILAVQHARLYCRRPEVRDAARAREAWTYREMAAHALKAGNSRDAWVFAGQALVTYPTLGGCAFAAKTLMKAAAGRHADALHRAA